MVIFGEEKKNSGEKKRNKEITGLKPMTGAPGGIRSQKNMGESLREGHCRVPKCHVGRILDLAL